MRSECRSVPLPSLGVLRARGPDTRSFLQGQLSNDLTRLTADRALLAGYHNPQGRVIALLRVLQLAPDDLLAILPRELVGTVAQRLGRFVLRAKVRLTDESPQWTITGVLGCEPASAATQPPPASTGAAGPMPSPATPSPATPSSATLLPASVNDVTRIDASLALRVAQQPARWLLLSPAAQPLTAGGCSAAGVELWQRLAIAAGEPQVYAATSEAFVAQMLNLDALGAIAFDKGCYTGQEVIARAHYRGKVKRRLQRFLVAAPARLAPGDDGELGDGRSFKVVDAAQRADGGCEFLAVTTIGPAPTASAAGGGAAGGSHPASPAAAPLGAQMLELPYALPD
jgi:tRNA-modifying protein YgfZ